MTTKLVELCFPLFPTTESQRIDMLSCAVPSVAVGSYLSGALVYVVGRYSVGTPGAPRGWLPDDLNRGRVDFFFLFLAGVPDSETWP